MRVEGERKHRPGERKYGERERMKHGSGVAGDRKPLQMSRLETVATPQTNERRRRKRSKRRSRRGRRRRGKMRRMRTEG